MFKKAITLITMFVLLSLSYMPSTTSAQEECRLISCLDASGEVLYACQDWVEEPQPKCVECTEFCDPIIIEG